MEVTKSTVKPPMTQPVPQEKPAVPTMTTATIMPPAPEPINPWTPAEELADGIVAAPLVMPDFLNIKLKNPTLAKRWINFKSGDGLRYSQALSQGWRNATKADVADGCITPYMKEGGSKYINGDLILMVIDKRRYLGALKHKHERSAALADASILRAVAARKAQNDLANAGANNPRNAIQQGRAAGQPRVQVFTPGETDVKGTVFEEAYKEGMREAARLGHEGPPEMGGARVPTLEERMMPEE